MGKLNHNRPVFQKIDEKDFLDAWDPYVGSFVQDDATFEENKRALMDFNKHTDENWAEKRVKAAKADIDQMFDADKSKAQITKCPPRTQHHVPTNTPTHQPNQFKKELKEIKNRSQAIHRYNKAGEAKKSNFYSTKALDDYEAAYCRDNLAHYTIKQLALKFKVSERCVTRCVKGITYKHLNGSHKPWK